jgi:hypothetical protein
MGVDPEKFRKFLECGWLCGVILAMEVGKLQPAPSLSMWSWRGAGAFGSTPGWLMV